MRNSIGRWEMALGTTSGSAAGNSSTGVPCGIAPASMPSLSAMIANKNEFLLRIEFSKQDDKLQPERALITIMDIKNYYAHNSHFRLKQKSCMTNADNNYFYSHGDLFRIQISTINLTEIAIVLSFFSLSTFSSAHRVAISQLLPPREFNA